MTKERKDRLLEMEKEIEQIANRNAKASKLKSQLDEMLSKTASADDRLEATKIFIESKVKELSKVASDLKQSFARLNEDERRRGKDES